MASLLSRFVASFDAIKPVPNLTGLDGEFNQQVGASGVFNGGTTGFKLLVKTSDATDPPVDQDQIGAGLLARWKQNGSSKATITNDGSLTANGVTGAAGVYTFGSIPVGPASDPTTANQLARKAYVDAKTTLWSASFFIQDPSTFPLNTFDLAQKALIPGAFTATHADIIMNTGTASGTYTVLIRKHPFADQTTQTTIGTINIDGTTPIGQGAELDIADHVFTAKDWVYVILSARSSPLQRDITITIRGFQTLV